jgi:glycosyltransferase involved in cell wall biosynthesis
MQLVREKKMVNDFNPKVTVLMSVYNSEKYLKEAIDSILNQTYKNFDFLIINDGSTDKSQAIIKSYNDSRIRLINHETNLGLIASLNKGLHLVNSEYIARMDSDDISFPERLEKQVSFMEKHPEVGICGTWLVTFGDRKGEIWKYPADPMEIKAHLMFNTKLAHATVLMRPAFLSKYNLNYNPEYVHVEDWELWQKASLYFNIVNIPEVLYKYRIHEESVCNLNKDVQYETAKKIRSRGLRQLGIEPTVEEEIMHHKIFTGKAEISKEFIIASERWLIKLIKANAVTVSYNAQYFGQYVARNWYNICNNATELGWWTWSRYHNSSIPKYQKVTIRKKLKLLIKSIIKWDPHKRINK